MGSSFGERLKQERLSRNLTQGELGGELYSASYISLLENAHREPTSEIIRQLAGKLLAVAPVTGTAVRTGAPGHWADGGLDGGVSAEQTVADGAASARDTDCLRLSLCARQSWDTRDYSGAASSATEAAELARDGDNSVSWWNMMFLAANAHMRAGNHDAAVAVLGTLLEDPMTVGCDALSMRADQVMAAAMLSQGSLAEAIEHATRAVGVGSGDSPEEFNAYLLALQTLVGALTEVGRLDEAWSHSLALAESITAATPPQVAGEIHWVVGNVAFIRRDTRAGLEHHSKAARLLSPTADLSRWAQFNKATAWVRLSAGIVEPATLQAIERSELAHSVVGATPAEIMEVSLLRARWHYLNGELGLALELLFALERDHEQLAPHIAGDTALLLGDTLRDSGRSDEARNSFLRALERFTQAGALDRAEVASGHLATL